MKTFNFFGLHIRKTNINEETYKRNHIKSRKYLESIQTPQENFWYRLNKKLDKLFK